MRYLRALPLLWMVGLSLAVAAAHAADEDVFLGQILPQSEQTVGRGHSALWTFPHIATQYQPAHTPPQMQRALQAQHEGRYLDALILLDEVERIGGGKNGSANITNDVNLLRASFLLQDKQTLQAVEILSPMIADHSLQAADALALTSMTHLQQGQTQEALAVAQRARALGDGLLPHLAFSYALQAVGRLAEARTVMHGFNTPPTHAQLSNTQLPNATSLAREAELALTLNDIPAARVLISQAAAHPSLASQPYAQPYVTSVSGLVALINNQPQSAKAAFETALQRDAKDARALLGMGLAAIQLGDFNTGQKNLRAANEADPGNALILTYLGRAQQQLGQTAAARSSWQQAQQADPKDPSPWLYQAQAQLQANQPAAARESLREAQARTAYRAVYRGESLLHEDAQLLQINTAEALRMQGLDELAFQTLSDGVAEKNAANLRSQADVLQNIRFAQSARRSVALQSLFNDTPGSMPLSLDIFGDGAGQTGAATPQHGVVSGLNAQQASFNDYGALFAKPNLIEVDGIVGNQGTQGGQARMGVGSDKVGLNFAYRQHETTGTSRFNGLDNTIWQGTLQWRPLTSTQAFVQVQEFDSEHGEITDPASATSEFSTTLYHRTGDHSTVRRVGLRHTFAGGSEWRGLVSRQKTQQDDATWLDPLGLLYIDTLAASSTSRSTEGEYRLSGDDYALQTGAQSYHGDNGEAHYLSDGFVASGVLEREARLYYAALQYQAHTKLALHTEIAWGRSAVLYKKTPQSNTDLRRWLPKLGIIFTPDAATTLRAAKWRSIGIPTVGGAALAPASLGGTILSRPEDYGDLVDAVSVAGERQINPSWLITASGQKREAGTPGIDNTGATVGFVFITQKYTEAQLALHWQPIAYPWVISLSQHYERIRNDSILTAPDSIDHQSLRSQQLNVRWVASATWMLNVLWSHNQVDGTLKAGDQLGDTTFTDVNDRFNQVDANLTWKSNDQSGSVIMGVRNATDQSFTYTETDKLSPRFSAERLLYAKFKLAI